MKTKLKIYITLASILCWVNFSCTEDVIVKETSSLRSSSLLSAEVVTIKLEQAGTLAEKIGDKKSTVESLVLSGPFNAVDVRCLREMSYLKYLDMEDVDIVDSEETYVVNYYSYDMAVKTEKNVIGDYMFWVMPSLVSVVLPKNTEKIGNCVFRRYEYNETHLETVVIPNTVKTIGNEAFRACVNLKNITLPKELESMGRWVFRDCRSLEQLFIPNTLRKIEEGCFIDCLKLKSITIPANMVMSTGGQFNGCSNLANINIDGQYNSIANSFFQGCGLMSFIIPEGVKSIGDNAFQNTKIISVSIPNTVVSIGNKAFDNTLLTSIVIPNSVTDLGSSALSNCSVLSSVILSSSLSTLKDNLFANDGSLRGIIIPSSVTSIDYDVFLNTGLETLVLPSSVRKVVRMAGWNKLPNLTSLFWDASCDCGNDGIFFSDNCLVYISNNAAIPPSWKNVIVKGTAESISLVEGVAYNCPKDFYAKKITFKKNFSMKTGNGEAAGWETIVLPFAATTIKNSSGDILAPFDSDVAGVKNFWLRELTTGGFKDVKTIEANKPYIIAMPNNSNYDSKYNITGDITFEAQNITVKATPNELKSISGPSFSMSPVYQNLPRANQIYVINEEQEFEGAKPGSIFVRNLRDLKPFEAYITPNGVAPSSLRMIRIDGPVRTKSASDNSLKNKM